MANNNSGKNEKDLVCSFCGKHQDEVERMIIGPGVNICSECIGLCHDLLSDKPDQPKSARPARGSASRAHVQPAAADLDINIMTPAEIKELPWFSGRLPPSAGFSGSATGWHRLLLGNANHIFYVFIRLAFFRAGPNPGAAHGIHRMGKGVEKQPNISH